MPSLLILMIVGGLAFFAFTAARAAAERAAEIGRDACPTTPARRSGLSREFLSSGASSQSSRLKPLPHTNAQWRHADTEPPHAQPAHPDDRRRPGVLRLHRRARRRRAGRRDRPRRLPG